MEKRGGAIHLILFNQSNNKKHLILLTDNKTEDQHYYLVTCLLNLPHLPFNNGKTIQILIMNVQIKLEIFNLTIT